MSTATANIPASITSSRKLHIGLWVAQGLLATAFLLAGATKLFTPVEELAASMPWVTGALGKLVRMIGTVEVLGAVGLILPSATRIMPKLTPLAALGLLTVMLLAAFTHIARGELSMIVANVVLGGLAMVIAWGRTKAAPVTARD